MNEMVTIALASSEISASTARNLMDTYNLNKEQFNDICSKTLNLIAKKRTKLGALAIVEKKLSILSTHGLWEKYDKLTIVKKIISQINV
jgi:CRISPR/Cas system-associated endonuclease Cas3-HD